MTTMRRRLRAFVTVATVMLVLAPMPLLLPALNDRTILSWHVLTYTDTRAEGYSHLALLLIGSYVLLDELGRPRTRRRLRGVSI